MHSVAGKDFGLLVAVLSGGHYENILLWLQSVYFLKLLPLELRVL
jgi:hypothetical protein